MSANKKTVLGIAIVVFPPHEEGRNLLSNFLQDLQWPSLFISANTSEILNILNKESCDLKLLEDAWQKMIVSTHSFILSRLNQDPEYKEVTHWMIVEDDHFMAPSFKRRCRELIALMPQEFDVVMLSANSAIPDNILTSDAFSPLIAVPFVPLSKLGALLVPVSRMKFLANAISTPGTHVRAYALMNALPPWHQYRGDVLPCPLRSGNFSVSEVTVGNQPFSANV